MKDERLNGLPDDGEEYLEDDFEADPHTPYIEPWRIEGACVEICGQIANLAEQLSNLANRLCSLYV